MTDKTKTRIADIVERGELHRRAYKQKLISTETLASVGQSLMAELQQAVAEDEETTAEEFRVIFNRIEKHSKRMSKIFKVFSKFIDE